MACHHPVKSDNDELRTGFANQVLYYFHYFVHNRTACIGSIIQTFPMGGNQENRLDVKNGLRRKERRFTVFQSKNKHGCESTLPLLTLLVYNLSIPSSSGVEMPSSVRVGFSSWITQGQMSLWGPALSFKQRKTIVYFPFITLPFI